MFKRIIITILSLVFIGSIYTLFRLDASIQPTDPELYPSVSLKDYTPRPPVVLINFAGGHEVFFKNQQAQNASAVNRGFDLVFSMNRDFMDPEFYEANRYILDQKTGAGRFLWKPYFILRAMESLPDDALIFYADSGVVFTKPINKIKRLLQSADMVLVKYSKPTPLSTYLKREAYEPLGITEDSPELNSEEIWAFFIAMRNNPETREFVRNWLQLCTNPAILTHDNFDKDNQVEHFRWPLHDESVLSVLVAKNPESKIVIPKRDIRKEYGVNNFHRHAHREHESPLMLAVGYHRFISELLWNNILMRYLRRLF